MTPPTHALIDGHCHPILRIETVENSIHTHRVHLQCGLLFDVRGAHEFNDPRWLGQATGDSCPDCSSAIADPKSRPAKFERAGTHVRRADIPIGISCPLCGNEIRLRRHDDGAACVQGHEYTVPEVQKVAVGLLQRLATQNLLPTKRSK